MTPNYVRGSLVPVASVNFNGGTLVPGRYKLVAHKDLANVASETPSDEYSAAVAVVTATTLDIWRSDKEGASGTPLSFGAHYVFAVSGNTLEGTRVCRSDPDAVPNVSWTIPYAVVGSELRISLSTNHVDILVPE